MSDQSSSEILNKIYSDYITSGLLIRTNDGNHPYSIEDVKNEIEKITLEKDSNLKNIINQNCPPYSWSLIINRTPQVAWYYGRFSEVFPKLDYKLGKRTIVSAMLKLNKARIFGGTCWDGDSNLRLLGVNPATLLYNRSNPFNITTQESSDGPIVGDNNNPYYNPMFYPRTESIAGKLPFLLRAETKEEVDNFLSMIGNYKKIWVNTLKENAGGFNQKFADYITNTYTSGVEPEILATNNSIASLEKFENAKFEIEDLSCVSFIMDNTEFNNVSNNIYLQKAYKFLIDATSTDGWINMPLINVKVPVIKIKSVALPYVAVSGQTTPPENLGDAWIQYLNKTGYETLNESDFTFIGYVNFGPIPKPPKIIFNYSNAPSIQDWQSIRNFKDNYYLLCGTSKSEKNDAVLYIGGIKNINSKNFYNFSYPVSKITVPYDINYIGNSTYRLVGNYMLSDDEFLNGFFWEGTLTDLNKLDNYKTINIENNSTIIYSIMENLLGGIFYTKNIEETQGFIMHINTGKIVKVLYPGSDSNRVFGIWYEGNNNYIIVGGYTNKNSTKNEINNNKKSFENAFIVNYNIKDNIFTNWTSFSYPFNNDIKNVNTYFRGINSSEKNIFQIAANSDFLIETKREILIKSSFVSIKKDNNGNFYVEDWTDFEYPLDSSITLVNSVVDNALVGTYFNEESIGFQAFE